MSNNLVNGTYHWRVMRIISLNWLSAITFFFNKISEKKISIKYTTNGFAIPLNSLIFKAHIFTGEILYQEHLRY